MAIIYGPASAAQIASVTARPRRKHHWWSVGGILVGAIVILNAIAQLSQPAAACRANCPTPPPPSSPPVTYGTVYRSSQYGFSLAYDARYAGSPTSTSSGSIAWAFPLKSGGYLDAKIFGSSSQGASPVQSVASAQSSGYGQFRAIYSIPSAEVGYVPGAGEIYEGQWTPLMGSSSTERLAITSATKKGVTVTVICEAPKASDKGEHPDPSRLGIGADQFCDEVGNTVAWKP